MSRRCAMFTAKVHLARPASEEADTYAGQIEILEKAMEVIEERIERVERLMSEGEGCPCCN